MAGNNRTTVWNMDTARGFVQWLGGALAIMAIAWSQLAGAQGSARLTAVEVMPLQGNTLQVRLRTDGTAPQLANTESSVSSSESPISSARPRI